jgi:hypothetical protein
MNGQHHLFEYSIEVYVYWVCVCVWMVTTLLF